MRLRWLMLALTIFFVSTVRAQGVQPAKVQCTAANDPYEILDSRTGKTTTHDNWTVECKIARGDKTLHAERLTLPYPASFTDAMGAIDEFRRRAPEILKGKR